MFYLHIPWRFSCFTDIFIILTGGTRQCCRLQETLIRMFRERLYKKADHNICTCLKFLDNSLRNMYTAVYSPNTVGARVSHICNFKRAHSFRQRAGTSTSAHVCTWCTALASTYAAARQLPVAGRVRRFHLPHQED